MTNVQPCPKRTIFNYKISNKPFSKPPVMKMNAYRSRPSPFCILSGCYRMADTHVLLQHKYWSHECCLQLAIAVIFLHHHPSLCHRGIHLCIDEGWIGNFSAAICHELFCPLCETLPVGCQRGSNFSIESCIHLKADLQSPWRRHPRPPSRDLFIICL